MDFPVAGAGGNDGAVGDFAGEFGRVDEAEVVAARAGIAEGGGEEREGERRH